MLKKLLKLILPYIIQFLADEAEEAIENWKNKRMKNQEEKEKP